jgi:hypothetical protein
MALLNREIHRPAEGPCALVVRPGGRLVFAVVAQVSMVAIY